MKGKMQEVGFEPTPPKRLVPETSALDHSATLAHFLCFSFALFLILSSLSSFFSLFLIIPFFAFLLSSFPCAISLLFSIFFLFSLVLSSFPL